MSVFVEFTYSGIFMVWVWNILCRLMYLVPRCCFLFCQVVGPVGPEGVEIHSGPPLCPLTCHLVHIDGNMLMGSGGSPAWILTVDMATAMPRIPVPQSHRNGKVFFPRWAQRNGMYVVHLHVSTNGWAVYGEKKIYKLAHSFFPDDCNLMLFP